VIVAECRSRANNLIGSHRGSHTAAAHENAPFHVSSCHGTGEGDRKIRIVIVGVADVIAEIDDLVAFLRQ
jgi:hypothetical protein